MDCLAVEWCIRSHGEKCVRGAELLANRPAKLCALSLSLFPSGHSRLSPREVPESIDELDPLQRGALIHEIQFAFFERLSADKLLPVGQLPRSGEGDPRRIHRGNRSALL